MPHSYPKSILEDYTNLANVGNVINDAVEHADLTDSIREWFDYYLKDDRSAQWIREGVK